MVPTATTGIVRHDTHLLPRGGRTAIGRYSPQTSPFGLRLILIWSCGDALHNGSTPRRASKISVRACGANSMVSVLRAEWGQVDQLRAPRGPRIDVAATLVTHATERIFERMRACSSARDLDRSGNGRVSVTLAADGRHRFPPVCLRRCCDMTLCRSKGDSNRRSLSP